MVEHTRTLDFKIAFALGLGTMIAAGIFSLSGKAVNEIGSTAVIAFTLAAIVAGITAASYSEFASIYSENGGGYLFISRTFEGRDRLKYGIGMALFLGYTGTTAFYLATMDEWFFKFILPETAGTLPRGTYGVLAAILLGVLNARGTEESGGFQLIVTAAKVLVLLIFIGGMFVAVGPGPATSQFAGSFEFEPVNTVSIASLAFITFFGFSAIAASAGEIIEPRKTVPRAIGASIVTVTILYALVIVAMTNIFNVTDRLGRAPTEILQEGETAMGSVAQAFIPVTVQIGGFSLTVGEALIVLGAVFSMVSASNASILAASGIGSLMGRQGHAPRPFSRIHKQYGTPFWSVVSVTITIVAMIVTFITLFGHHGYVNHFLGLERLTGFATFNLLVPLAIVNITLIYSRRNFPNITRGFRVPGVPLVPAIGVIANIALISQLPYWGTFVGIVVVAALLGVYLVWGGAPAIEDLYKQVRTPPESTTPEEAGETTDGVAAAEDRFRILVPIARPSRAKRYVQLAGLVGNARAESPLIQVVTVTEIPDQTPSELAEDTARKRADRIQDNLAEFDLDIDYAVEGHICRDVAFDIVQTARNDEADLILMGYPEEHPEVAESVEYRSPCDVLYTSGFPDDPEASMDVINIGIGGGPHHEALLPLADALGSSASEVHLISVNASDGPADENEDPSKTLSAFEDTETVQIHSVTASTIADGLVSTARENGGVLMIGVSRDRRLRRWVFGSTPDRVINLASGEDGLPVVVYASTSGITQRIEDYLFPLYKYARRFGQSTDVAREEDSTEI